MEKSTRARIPKRLSNIYIKKRRKRIPKPEDILKSKKRKIYYRRNKNKIKRMRELRERKLTEREKKFRRERAVVLRARREGKDEKAAVLNYRKRKGR